MGKIIIRLILLVSLAFNVAFALHLMSMSKEKAGIDFEESLSPTQALQLRQIHEQNSPRHIALAQKLNHYQFELLSILKAPIVDSDKLDACLQEIRQTRSESQRQIVDEILQSRKILSREQCGCLLDKVGESMNVSGHACNADCCPPQQDKVKK